MTQATACIVLLLCIQVAISDLYARRVSNLGLLVALSAGTAAVLLDPGAEASMGTLLLGFVAGFALLPFYACGWMGAGDVKFFATLGFLLGAGALLQVWMLASLIAGLHALMALAVPRLVENAPIVRQVVEQSQTALQRAPLHQRMVAARQGRQGLPYAAYLAFAATLLLLAGGAHA